MHDDKKQQISFTYEVIRKKVVVTEAGGLKH